MAEPYKINDKDIESVMRWLKIHDPDHATREDAIAMLQDLHTGFHQMAHNNPDKLAELQKELERSD